MFYCNTHNNFNRFNLLFLDIVHAYFDYLVEEGEKIGK